MKSIVLTLVAALSLSACGQSCEDREDEIAQFKFEAQKRGKSIGFGLTMPSPEDIKKLERMQAKAIEAGCPSY